MVKYGPEKIHDFENFCAALITSRRIVVITTLPNIQWRQNFGLARFKGVHWW